ncbi:GIY-YIG nuclease family protein, partial [Pantoea sp. Ft+CA_17]|uniref:GIY-YIG nuclease family protein n=1 Tax=Pantoea sp. Ft+CA_17 TaxID=2929508 RepID=UPI002117CA2C
DGMPKPNSVIYFVQFGDRIKIGFTADLRQRLRVFRSTLLGDVRLIGSVPGARKLESEIHKRLKDHRVGGDWFKACPEVQQE